MQGSRRMSRAKRSDHNDDELAMSVAMLTDDISRLALNIADALSIKRKSLTAILKISSEESEVGGSPRVTGRGSSSSTVNAGSVPSASRYGPVAAPKGSKQHAGSRSTSRVCILFE